MKNLNESFYDRLDSIWEKHSIFISLIVCLIVGVLYYFDFVTNIRMVTGNIVMFASIVIGVNGVFLTLIITLQESPAFTRLKEFFPDFQIRLYTSLRNQINFGILVVAISILINLLPPSPSRYLSAFGVSVWFFFFTLMGVGSFFSVKLVTDIIIKNFNIPTRNKRI